MVKSNSLPATKSIASDALKLPAGSTATFAPMSPAFKPGLTAFIASIALTSEAKEGAEVCATTRSKSRAVGASSASFRPCGGASTSLLPGTRAAGWASQVGYQNDRISRRAW